MGGSRNSVPTAVLVEGKDTCKRQLAVTCFNNVFICGVGVGRSVERFPALGAILSMTDFEHDYNDFLRNNLNFTLHCKVCIVLCI